MVGGLIIHNLNEMMVIWRFLGTTRFLSRFCFRHSSSLCWRSWPLKKSQGICFRWLPHRSSSRHFWRVLRFLGTIQQLSRFSDRRIGQHCCICFQLVLRWRCTKRTVPRDCGDSWRWRWAWPRRKLPKWVWCSWKICPKLIIYWSNSYLCKARIILVCFSFKH